MNLLSREQILSCKSLSDSGRAEIDFTEKGGKNDT